MAPRKKKEVTDDLPIKEVCNMSPAERFRILNAERMAKKFPDARHNTGANESSSAFFLRIPDLYNQWALGRVGYAMGRISYILAEEGTSKTSRLLYKCNLAIKAGGLATIIEWEDAMDPDHIRYYLGDDADKLIIHHANSLEEGMEMSREVLRQYAEIDPEGLLVKVLGADSIGGSIMERALIEGAEEHEIGDARVGGTGLYMSAAVPLIKHLCVKTNTLWVVLGQLREKIETGFSGPPKAYLEKVTGKGGKALPFEATYWEILQRGKTIKDSDGTQDGFRVKSTFKKNKRGVQWREYFYEVVFYENLSGMRPTMEMLAIGAVGGIRTKPGGAKGKLYWTEHLNMSDKEAMKIDEIYHHIHLPNNIGVFQKALGIKSDMSDMEEPIEEESAEAPISSEMLTDRAAEQSDQSEQAA